MSVLYVGYSINAPLALN